MSNSVQFYLVPTCRYSHFLKWHSILGLVYIIYSGSVIYYIFNYFLPVLYGSTFGY